MDDYAELAELYDARVGSYTDAPDGYSRQWALLCAAILSHAGRLVVPPLVPDVHIEDLLQAGHLSTDPMRVETGRPSSCHANIADAWAHGRAHTICTGYALSDDDLWRQHTWGVAGERTPVILESTEPRTRYFGIRLTGLDALVFAMGNDPDAVAHAASLAPGPRTRQLWDAMGAVVDTFGLGG